jgi:hypothetical protein
LKPTCPVCGKHSDLTDVHEKPQTRELFDKGMDNYVCKNGHEFEGVIPLKIVDGYCLRADM